MELYHKKLNTKIKKENNRYNNNRYNPKENSFNETANKTFYVQKMFRKKNIIQQKDDLNLSSSEKKILSSKKMILIYLHKISKMFLTTSKIFSPMIIPRKKQ